MNLNLLLASTMSEVLYELSELERACLYDSNEPKAIGTEDREQLAINPAQAKVVSHGRPKTVGS